RSAKNLLKGGDVFPHLEDALVRLLHLPQSALELPHHPGGVVQALSHHLLARLKNLSLVAKPFLKLLGEKGDLLGKDLGRPIQVLTHVIAKGVQLLLKHEKGGVVLLGLVQFFQQMPLKKPKAQQDEETAPRQSESKREIHGRNHILPIWNLQRFWPLTAKVF